MPFLTHQEPAVRQRDDRLEIGLRRDALGNARPGAQRLHPNRRDLESLRRRTSRSATRRATRSRSSITATHCLVDRIRRQPRNAAELAAVGELRINRAGWRG